MREIIKQVSNTAKPRKQHVKDASVHVCVAASQEEVLCTVVFFPLHRFLFACPLQCYIKELLISSGIQ